MVPLDPGGVEGIEVAGPALQLRAAVAEDVVDDAQQAVAVPHRRLLTAAPPGDAVDLGGEVRVAALNAPPGDLAHDPAQPHVALPRRAVQALPPALPVAWSHQVPCPGRTVTVVKMRTILGRPARLLSPEMRMLAHPSWRQCQLA